MTDGSSLTGVVLMEGANGVELDTVVDGRRTILSIGSDDIKAINRGELPEDFFEGTTARRDADAEAPANGAYVVLLFAANLGLMSPQTACAAPCPPHCAPTSTTLSSPSTQLLATTTQRRPRPSSRFWSATISA